MSAYTDVVDAARNRDGKLFKQVQRAVLYYAGYVAVAEDDITDPTGVKRGWAKRVRLGTLSIAEEYAEKLVPLVLENQDIAAGQVVPVDANGVPIGPAPGVADSLVQQIVETNLPTIWNG